MVEDECQRISRIIKNIKAECDDKGGEGKEKERKAKRGKAGWLLLIS